MASNPQHGAGGRQRPLRLSSMRAGSSGDWACPQPAHCSMRRSAAAAQQRRRQWLTWGSSSLGETRGW